MFTSVPNFIPAALSQWSCCGICNLKVWYLKWFVESIWRFTSTSHRLLTFKLPWPVLVCMRPFSSQVPRIVLLVDLRWIVLVFLPSTWLPVFLAYIEILLMCVDDTLCPFFIFLADTVKAKASICRSFIWRRSAGVCPWFPKWQLVIDLYELVIDVSLLQQSLFSCHLAYLASLYLAIHPALYAGWHWDLSLARTLAVRLKHAAFA